jgi:CTP:molybdopterin cytidylyltransferase MocA
MKLKGDVGAKSIISKYADNVLSIDIPEAEFDIDTESDYMDLLSR